MTRKDYELLAAALKAENPRICGDDLQPSIMAAYRLQWVGDCEAIAQCLARGNRAFDVDLFLRNCGVEV